MKLSTTAVLSLAASCTLYAGAFGQDSTSLFVAGYDGFVRTVRLDHKECKHSLSEINKTDGCGPNPNWLSLDYANQRLWCLNEGWNTPNGTVSTFDVEESGRLIAYQQRNTSASPVQSKFFDGGRKLAVAQFGGPKDSGIRGGLTIHDVAANGSLHSGVTNITFDALQTPGPANNQAVPRGHGVILDPTGKNLVVTDYGADKIRVFSITSNGTVTKGAEMEAPAGSAPRHAVFYTTVGGEDASSTAPVYLFVLAENANTISTYNITYTSNPDLLHLSPPTRVIDTFGGNVTKELNGTAKAGEIHISPDNNFVIVSNRLDSFTMESDSLSTYKINADGSLTFIQRVAAGGISPRHFKLNKAGDKVVVSHGVTSNIAVLKRDVTTGMIGAPLASLTFNTSAPGTSENLGIPMAIWYE
ncbi:uncharacterized protein HMPREF1541_02942 [Cyphellophora europaea CBS 101466]|uniref:6-phosphogluconolactonase n=1 Tax=Cyphellophora europaea (strain CBS 101466) TaxID=1220924 RepID=W2RZA9_CYPE1|nr:uncharacterized protein HMPREF1541_02942 [Cyphellophora europaea CBS 101466]ETN41009.1 hypothetical protein HMPREF1541_02942 [Cyphellophora europaea CBS 101466]